MTKWQPEALAEKPSIEVEVDCHVHLFPDKLFAVIGDWFRAAGWSLAYPCRSRDVIGSLEAFGIKRFWALPYAHKPGIARGLNEYIAGLAKDHPQIVPFFSVHPADDVRAEAEYAVDRLGARGMKIHAEVQQVGIDDPRLDPAFDLLEDRGLPCLLHAGNDPYPIKMEMLDFARTENRLARNPNLAAVIGHLGSPDTTSYFELFAKYPNLHLEVAFTNVPPIIQIENPKPADLAPFVDRLLFGSDFPYITFPYSRQVESWARLDWVQEHKEAFFGGNAKRLIGE